ncbi:MAG TPA: adenine deaminase [Proteobacteria bacterium]|nr:adenine deaminase [bacterium BMS3Abin14]HDL52495.1 adenine deaminase [Pseudomonadota bacterium]
MTDRFLQRVLAVSRGDEPASLLLKNARLINTFTGEIQETGIAIMEDRIAGLGEYDADEVIDLEGSYVAPGFIEAHFHIESTMLRPGELARVIVPRGTTCMVADPHEIANVSGLEGIEFILADSEGIPLDLYLMAPSCVPATTFETSGAEIGIREIERLLNHPRVLGLAEVMNFPGVVHGDDSIITKILASAGKPIDGHAPMLSGKPLNAYAAAGIQSDHECTNAEEAREKVRLGLRIMMREGTSAHDLANLLPAVTQDNFSRFMLVTDDRHPDELMESGHLDLLLRKAAKHGLDPVQAIRMVTINPAEHFGLKGRGAVAPGYLADLVVFDDMKSFQIRAVFKSGKKVSSNGIYFPEVEPASVQNKLRNSINLRRITDDYLRIFFSTTNPLARIMEIVPGALITKGSVEEIKTDEDGFFLHDSSMDLASLFVLERHHGSGRCGKGIVKGFGLQRGAIASSVAHDSHNIVCVSADSKSAAAAVNALIDSGGGLSVAVDGECLATLALPISGLLYDGAADSLVRKLREVKSRAGKTGCPLEDPFMILSFLALPVIPELKLTDRGLFDVTAFSPVELEVSE